MPRLFVVLGLVAAMLVSGAGVALAHPAPAEANAQGFGSEPVAKAGLGHASANGIATGIFPGFVVHAPTCLAHPILGH